MLISLLCLVVGFFLGRSLRVKNKIDALEASIKEHVTSTVNSIKTEAKAEVSKIEDTIKKDIKK